MFLSPSGSPEAAAQEAAGEQGAHFRQTLVGGEQFGVEGVPHGYPLPTSACSAALLPSRFTHATTISGKGGGEQTAHFRSP